MGNESFMYIAITIVIATFCLTWLLFFTIYALTKYTDFGKQRKKDNKKRDKIQNSQDDLPSGMDGDELLNLFAKPKIETSFGDKRIGEVHEHEKKT